MNHEFAVQTLASERYFLGEMPPAERDTFEEHYFSCAACANDVHWTAVFVSNAKAVFAGPAHLPPPATSAWRTHFVSGCAVMAFAALIGYQNIVTIPALKAPQFIGSAAIL